MNSRRPPEDLTQEQQTDASHSTGLLETETERRIGAIWIDVLGVEQVYRTSHFFQLGGESLLAMRMITRVRRNFGVRVPVRTIFDTPNLDGFSALVDTLQSR